ncbi:MAG: zinc-ribbon domain-containing protein [Bacillota bacterium]|nr:zinc-ribbon domain-containing protein [Bacillota bacterium]
MPDKTLICKDCSEEFVFTEGEQSFFKEKGFEKAPVRCPACRRARKQNRCESRGGKSYGSWSFNGTGCRGGERK